MYNIYSLSTYPILSSFKFGRQVSLHLPHCQAGMLGLIEMKVLTRTLSRTESGAEACVLEKSSFNHSMWFSADKGPCSHSYGFSSSYVQVWELDHKEGWAPKNWCFQIVLLEKTPESPLDCKEIKSVNPKGNQPWILFGRTAAEAEAPVLWPSDVKSWLIGKDSDDAETWGQEKSMAEDKVVR